MLNGLKRTYVDTMSWMIYGVATVTGPVHAPWTHKKTDYTDVLSLRKVLQPGDLILTRTRGEFTTLTIPGYWKHTILYLGCDDIEKHDVTEAVMPRVRTNYLANVIMKTDYYAVRRVKGGMNPEQLERFNREARLHIGKKYDRRLRVLNKNSIYCSEQGYHALNAAFGYEYMELRERLGYLSVSPDDYWFADGKFETVYTNYRG